MAQNTHARGNHRSAVTTYTVDEEVCEEHFSFPYRTAYNMAEKLATTRIGQFIISRSDDLLRIIENTAKWSIPQDHIEEKLQRPLPWIPFLMLIVMLRFIRIAVSIGALFIGNSPVTAKDVVYFLQTRRRKLRALRYRGLKEMHRRNMEIQARKPGFGPDSFVAQLKRFFSAAICRPGVHREPERRIMIHQGKEVVCGENDRKCRNTKRPRDDDCEADMTVDEMLNKYADDNTEDDSDFVPNLTNDDSDLLTNRSDEKLSGEETSSCEDSQTYVEGAIVHHPSSSKKTKEQQHNKNISNSSKDQSFDRSVEIKQNGKGEPIILPKPIAEIKQEVSTDNESSDNIRTPHENGPSSYDAENRELDVAFQFVLTPPEAENDNKTPISSPEMNVQKSHAARTERPNRAEQMIPTLKTTMTAATEIIPTIDLNSTTESSSDAVDTPSTTSFETSKFEISTYPTDTSAASSTTSLDSLKQIHEILTKNAAIATKTSTPIIEATTTKTNDFENSIKNSTSSSEEDDFYSPIGSPPDFNAYQKVQTKKRFNSMPGANSESQSQPQKATSEPNIPKDSAANTFLLGNSSTRRNQQQSHGNSRYRGRNRR